MTTRAHDNRKAWAMARQRGALSCFYCGIGFTHDDPPTIDHIIPRSEGGTRTPENTVMACKRCNMRKGKKPFDFAQGWRRDA